MSAVSLVAMAAFAFSACAQIPPSPPGPMPGAMPLPPVPPALPAPPIPAAAAADVQSFNGVARQYLMNEFGDVEGVLAQDGTQVRFPPHMSGDLVRAVRPGDRFVAQGRGVAGGNFRAYAIGKEGMTPLVESRPSITAAPPLPPQERAASLADLQVDGVVSTVLFAPRGEVDGVVLNDGTIVKLPRHARFDQATLHAGSRVTARGYGTRNAYGRSLRAQMIGIDGQAMLALQPEGPRGKKGRRGDARGMPPPPPLPYAPRAGSEGPPPPPLPPASPLAPPGVDGPRPLPPSAG